MAKRAFWQLVESDGEEEAQTSLALLKDDSQSAATQCSVEDMLAIVTSIAPAPQSDWYDSVVLGPLRGR